MIRVQHVVFLLVVLLGSFAGIVSAAQERSETRLILSHTGRFTTEIPADWGIDRTQRTMYTSDDGDGYIQATTFAPSVRSLPNACEATARLLDPESDPTRAIIWVTFQQQFACRIEAPSDIESATAPIVLIFLHSNPLRSGIDGEAYFGYTSVTVDRAHFDEVTASMRFDLEDVTPELYLEAAIDLIETFSLVRDDVDWATVRREAANEVLADDPASGIDHVLSALVAEGDDHSYRWQPSVFDAFAGTSAADIPESELPKATAFSSQISYLNVPPVQGDSSVFRLYATTGNQAIAEVDASTTCGWIIDLRTNFGGNTEPMIVAVGEILGDGPFGGNVFSNGETELEAYRDGAVFAADGSVGESLIDGPVYDIAQPEAAVAVLIGPGTGSAGEYTAIAFQGRDSVMTFGEPSADLTTGISGFLLADGSALGLATSAMVDRNGMAYPDGIEPDTYVEFDLPSVLDPSDPVAAAAEAWLLEQPVCQ